MGHMNVLDLPFEVSAQDDDVECRFASAFTLGSGLIMASFFALKGFRAQLAHMLDKDRLLFSIGAPHSRRSVACVLVLHQKLDEQTSKCNGFYHVGMRSALEAADMRPVDSWLTTVAVLNPARA